MWRHSTTGSQHQGGALEKPSSDDGNGVNNTSHISTQLYTPPDPLYQQQLPTCTDVHSSIQLLVTLPPLVVVVR